MAAQISARGRLVADPRSPGQTRTGNSMAFARIAVDMGVDEETRQRRTLWLAVAAFGRQADTLQLHSKGDIIGVAGRLELRTFKDKTGAPREGWQCVADSVIGIRAVSANAAGNGNGNRGQGNGEPPAHHDEIPW